MLPFQFIYPVSYISSTEGNMELHLGSTEEIKPLLFMQIELALFLKTIQSRKDEGPTEIPPDLLNTRGFVEINLRLCKLTYDQNTIDK